MVGGIYIRGSRVEIIALAQHRAAAGGRPLLAPDRDESRPVKNMHTPCRAGRACVEPYSRTHSEGNGCRRILQLWYCRPPHPILASVRSILQLAGPTLACVTLHTSNYGCCTYTCTYKSSICRLGAQRLNALAGRLAGRREPLSRPSGRGGAARGGARWGRRRSRRSRLRKS